MEMLNLFQRVPRRTFLFWGALALFIGVSPIVWRWLRDEDTPTSPASDPQSPAVEATGAQSIVMREDGRKVWEFSAQRITISPDHRYATATGVQRGVMYRDNRPFIRMQATQVRMNQETRDWQAKGALKAQGPDGFSIQSPQAQWTHAKQQLQCPTNVQATLRGMKIATRQVVYDAGRSELRCPQPVEVTSPRATMKTQHGTQVVADIKRRRVEFQGGVEIVVRPPA
jgi:hypothetical protein